MESPRRRHSGRRDAAQTGGDSPVLEVVDVAFDYAGVAVLHGVSLTVGAGEVVALAGVNGSGKSTLLAVAAGLVSPRSGTVRRAGGDDVALVFQSTPVPETLPLTVAEVVAMGRWPSAGLWRPLRRSDRDIVDRSIDDLGLAAVRARPMHDLSGGQRQRAFVAQGLAREAALLLLDEPMTALDADSRGAVARAIRTAASRGAGVCLVTHDDSAGLADRVIRLDGGRVVSERMGAGPL